MKSTPANMEVLRIFKRKRAERSSSTHSSAVTLGHSSFLGKVRPVPLPGIVGWVTGDDGFPLLERRPCSTKVDSWASANSTTELVKIDQFFDALGRRPHRRGLAGGCWWALGGNHGDRRRGRNASVIT